MNLIIDGHAFLNVSINIVKNMMYRDPEIGKNYWVEDIINDGFILKEKAKSIFRDFSLKYINSIASTVSDLNYTFIVFDLKNSWRKNYLDGVADERDIEYKGQRKYDEHQGLFFKYFIKDILDEIQETNIIKLSVQGAEGDDIIVKIIEKHPKDDFMIWSVDLDFIQLLSNEPRFVMLSCPKMSRKTKNIYTANNYDLRLKSAEDSFDPFDFSFSKNVDYIGSIMKKPGHLHLQMNPDSELIIKILGGDDSDNIPRVHKKMTKTKVQFISSIVLEEYLDLIKEIDTDPVKIIEFITQHIQILFKIKDLDEIKNLKRALVTNVKIIRLNSRFIPVHVNEDIDKALISSDKIKFNFSPLKKLIVYNANTNNKI